ncbi:MAG: hemerythrin domain-containing protein [Gammaproteobacteria bacterium]|nr:hemerythrin domain-containing protein [Gammaproteobacteria bacterium]
MNSPSEHDLSKSEESPLNEFSGCHEGIIQNFNQLKELVDLHEKTPGAEKIKPLAKKLLSFFDEVVIQHHSEEEQELFTIVMDCASKGEEADTARNYIKQLVAEHRQLEKMWKQIEGDIRRLSKGKRTSLDNDLALKLAKEYLEHAKFEEEYFLPLSAKILSKNDLSALGLSLHIRHMDPPTHFYI